MHNCDAYIYSLKVCLFFQLHLHICLNIFSKYLNIGTLTLLPTVPYFPKYLFLHLTFNEYILANFLSFGISLVPDCPACQNWSGSGSQEALET